MRDPHTSLQMKEFTTANAYFLRDPATVDGVGALTADKFIVAERAPGVASMLASKARANWGDRRQTHSLRPNDRFLTEQRRRYNIAGEEGGLKSEARLPRHCHEFTKSYDKVTFGVSKTSEVMSEVE